MKLIALLIISLFPAALVKAQVNIAAGDAKNMASRLNDSAVKLRKEKKYDAALGVINQALAAATYNKDSLLMARCLNNTGLIYNSKGDPKNSIFYYEKSLALLWQLREYEQVHTSLLNLGIAYKDQANYDKAKGYLLDAATYFEANRHPATPSIIYQSIRKVIKNRNLRNLSSAYNAMGNMLRVEEDFPKALKYHSDALEIRQEIQYEEGIAHSFNNIGIVYRTMGKYDSALFYFNMSLKLKETEPESESLANTLSNIAEVYLYKADYERAEKYYLDARSILERIDNQIHLAQSYYDLGFLNYQWKKQEKAEAYLLTAIAASEEVGAPDILLKCYHLLKELYTAKRNYPKAIHYAEKYIIMHEKVLGSDKQKSLAQQEVKYETEKNEREILHLNREMEKTEAVLLSKELQLETRNIHNRNLVITVVLTGCIALLLLLLVRDRNRFAKRIDMVMRELHHRVKNNFQVLLSLFSLQLENIRDEEARKVITSNRDRVTAMMLIHSGLYFDEDVTKVKVSQYVHNLVNSLITVYGLRNREINIVYNISDKLDINVDKAIPLGLLINELVTNCFKYAFGEHNTAPELEISLTKDHNGQHHLLIRDNGPGINTQELKRSFGLKLSESQVKQLKGTIHPKNENGLIYHISFE